jgi:hypothetical protein
VTNTKCRRDTVISPDDGHTVARNMQRKEINILRKIVHQVGFIYGKRLRTWHKNDVVHKNIYTTYHITALIIRRGPNIRRDTWI